MVFAKMKPIASTSALALLLFFLVLVPLRAALADACVLQPDRHSPSDQVLVCGADLKVQPEPGTIYRPSDPGRDGPPASVELESGALLIDFLASEKQRDFQILTPLAIASVRGTRWAVEARFGRTSVLVLRGAVSVSRRNAAPALLLRPGEGVDVRSDGSALEVTQWSSERVSALMARFGQ
jgi:hypothetical protein